jgi:methionine synthase II (cobalamin-independent)
MARAVHLVGSVPLANSAEVFRAAAETFGTDIKRIPDGETGARGDWVQWLTHILSANPQFELPGGSIDYSAGRDVRHYYRVKAGIDPAKVLFGELGYADAARQSYAVFAKLVADGDIPAATRFLVAMPTPLAFLQVLIAPDQRAALERAYTQSIKEEIAALATVVPASKLAIQWDTVFEVLILEGVRKSGIDDTHAGLIERLRLLGAELPAEVELGYHFCYGDMNHKHSLEPPHMGVMVDLANDLARALPHRIDFIHMPVPRGRDDAAYFAPLSRLALNQQTELYLGLVHFTDGIEGTRNRMATAARVRPEFGIATECGFGRRAPETVRRLLDIHAEAARD